MELLGPASATLPPFLLTYNQKKGFYWTALLKVYQIIGQCFLTEIGVLDMLPVLAMQYNGSTDS